MGAIPAPEDVRAAGVQPTPEARPLVILDESLAPLVAEFNAHPAAPHVVALLSPTCRVGTQALREALLSPLAQEEFRLTVIWTNVFEGDCHERMTEAMARLDDPRVSFFYDPERRAGRAFARRFLPVAAACDLYLFYPPGAEWQALPPRPRSWAHQLGRVSDHHCATSAELIAAIEDSLGELLAESR